jgi:hypothetical protein
MQLQPLAAHRGAVPLVLLEAVPVVAGGVQGVPGHSVPRIHISPLHIPLAKHINRICSPVPACRTRPLEKWQQQQQSPAGPAPAAKGKAVGSRDEGD